MLHHESTSEPALRNAVSNTTLQNRAFVEISRVLASGEAAVLSSALPILLQGAGLTSAAIYALSQDELSFVAAEGAPLKLRALLGDPALLASPDFLVQRVFKQHRTLIDHAVFGQAQSPAVKAALEEAGWQFGLAVPILAAGKCGGVLLCGGRAPSSFSGAVTFLEAMGSVLGAAALRSFKPPLPPLPGPSVRGCPGCTAAVAEVLGALGREVSAQHALLRELGARKGAPPEAEALAGSGRAIERCFRRLSEVVLHVPASQCPHVRRSSSMASVVEAAVQGARPALTAAHTELEVVCGPICDFEGDPEMVAIALRHLIVNAAEAFDGSAERERVSLPSGARRVRVFVRNEGPALAVHVEDSGPGLPQDLRSRVFEPSVSTKGPGRGLGLAVARHVIEALGGWMELGSSELGGARASVFLPLRSAAIDELRRAPTLQIPARMARRSVRPGA